MSKADLRPLLIATLLLLAGSASAASICAPAVNPCVVSADTNVPGGTTIDIGARDFVIAAGKTLNVQSAGRCSVSQVPCTLTTDCAGAQFCRPSALTIIANHVILQDGSKILAGTVGGLGQDVVVHAAGIFAMGTNSRIDASGGSAGALSVAATVVGMGGLLRAQATDRDGDGGDVSIDAAVDLTISGGGIEASAGARFGCTVGVQLFAGRNLTVYAPIIDRGGDCDGGDIDLSAGGNVVVQPTGSLDVNATYEGGSAGSLFIDAGGSVNLSGPYLARGQGTLLEGGGDGGDIDVIAQSLTVGAQVELVGAGPDGSGGFFDVTTTGGVTISAPILVTGAADGVGGDVFLDAGGLVNVGANVDLRAGVVGGSFDVSTIGDVSIASGVTVDASAIGSALGRVGGTASIFGCSITIPTGAAISTAGTGSAVNGKIGLFASNLTTIGGTLIGGGGGVVLHYRTTPPVIQGSALIVPSPSVAREATLPCCVACPVPTTTSSSTSTTTSSSLPDTTSTSSITTTSEPTITSTTTSSSSSSSATSSSSTSVSSTSVSSTTAPSTSTTIPLSCLDEPLAGYPAVDCAITVLQDMVAAQDKIALGGRKSAKRLAGKITKMQVLVEKARTAKKAAKLLVKAEKRVVSFQTQISKLQARTKIEESLASELLELSGEVTVRIDGVLTPLTN